MRLRITYINVLVFLLTTIIAGCSLPDDELNLENRVVVATMGASLMYAENGWVETACKNLNILCLNKAVNSEITIHFAQKLWRSQYASQHELENIDILLIQFANCKDVYGNDTMFMATADDYTATYTADTATPFAEYNYAQQMDYILKKWQQICTQYNKPMHVIFMTHWHDARVTYNHSIRLLAQRWNADICELDTHIGFTKDQPLADGSQPSLQYAKDTEDIDGILYGWHPKRGKEGKYIQSVMASILTEKLSDYLSTHTIQ